MTVASDWVTAGAAWRASLTPIGAESTADQDRQPRVVDINSMTPAAAARAYSRVLAGRQLLDTTSDSTAQQIAGPRILTPPEFNPRYSELTGNESPLGDVSPPPPPVTQPSPTPSLPSTTTPTPQANTPLGVVPESSSPIPAPSTGTEGSGPLFDRPDISGKKEGDSWTVVRDGFTHTYTIPVGNGNKSVDQKVTRDDVLIGNSRVAYGDDGGAQQWVDVVGSASLYADQDSANSNQYTQVFNSGSPTSGTPDNVLGTLPDLKTTFTLVDNGVPVGSLEQIGTEPGLYHTAYINKDGDISVWRTNETEQGGLVTNPINYLDHTGRGWYGGNLSGGPLWEVTPKLDGSSLFTNTELTNSGTHVRVWDPSNETRSDKFYSNSGTGGYLAATNANGTTIDGDDGSHTRYDRLGKLIECQGPTKKDPKPDLRSNYERFTSFSRDVATGFEAAYSETKTGIIALLGQQDRDDGIAENWPGAPKLAYRLWASAMDGSLKDAWLGLATSGVGIGAGLAFTAIDLAAISAGQGSWGQLGRDILGTGNEVSIFAIGADWTQAGEAPGETIGRGLFGSMLLLGPKGINMATSKLPPPSAVNAAMQNATNVAIQNTSDGLGNIGRSFGRPTFAPANVRNFPGMARVPGQTGFATATGSTPSGRGSGGTLNAGQRTSQAGQTPARSIPVTTGRGRTNSAPLLPAEPLNAGARDSIQRALHDGNAEQARDGAALSPIRETTGASTLWESQLGVTVDQIRSMSRERISEYQVRRANIDPEYRAQYYDKIGRRLDLKVVDETGWVPPQLKETSSGNWLAATDVPEAAPPRYRGDIVLGLASELPASGQALMNGFALDRLSAVQAVPKSKDVPGYSAAQGNMSKTAERYGEAALRHHAVAVKFPQAVELELHGPQNGNHQFDQVWWESDSGLYIVGEAKSQESTGLNSRALPSGLRVSQGSIEYFLDILRMMKLRGAEWRSEALLAEQLRIAWKEGRLWYGVVYGRPGAGGTHSGYKMLQFDI